VCLQDEFDLAAKNLVLGELEAAYATAGLAFHHHPIADGDAALLASRLPEILAVIAAALSDRRRVYVHCNAGFNRAPTVAIAFLRAHRGLSDEAAWAHVKQRRACAPYRRALELHFDDPAAR
jgi:protein-tyrosine phosphatase